MSMSSAETVSNLGRLILVSGPTRSGKSEWAEQLAQQTRQSVVYIATSVLSPDDLDWQARIQIHRDRRPSDWACWEVPIALADVLSAPSDPCCLLVDSLGTWVANGLDQTPEDWTKIQNALIQALENTAHQVILVAEEVGWGIVPAYPTGRLFRDRLGDLVRRIGGIADQVYLVAAGYALDLKQLGQPVPARH
ncbi:MAG: bifunctional adenosylcobinamide kinase/adenosylcobinamide-phosphate guanylyltransferase [Thermosynechococcaceae cyanobacterium]